MITRKKMFVILLAVLFGTQFVHAQRWSTSNGSPPINPNSGLEIDPIFYYDPADGVLSVFNAGPNGVDDTMDGPVDGDDFGLISLLLTASSDIVSEPQILPVFGGGIAWGAPVFFNGKVQLAGNVVAGPGFLAISEDPVPLIQLLPDLTDNDFRNDDGIVSIETGGNFDMSSPGNTLFTIGDAFETGAFRIVPEPGAFGMLLLAGLALLNFRRR